jgi:ABC-type polysaccharide/polyol phosphate export permease
MWNKFALSVPRRGPEFSEHRIALVDVVSGWAAARIWLRLGWADTKRRYRRTTFGPLWSTVSLGLFVITLGIVWANLWHKDPKLYLPYLASGMLCWIFIVGICTEGGYAFCHYEKVIKQLRVSYTLLACAITWRHATVFMHNLIVYALIAVYGGVSVGWPTLLIFPGLALFFINAVWIVIVLGTAGARYRDLLQLVANLLQIALFITPVFWSPDQMIGRAVYFAQFNPLYHLIEIIREPLMGQVPSEVHWSVALGTAVIGWAIVIQLLRKVRHLIVFWV